VSEQGLTAPPTQYRLLCLGDSFTGQNTQPTASKYWRNTKIHKIHNMCTHI